MLDKTNSQELIVRNWSPKVVELIARVMEFEDEIPTISKFRVDHGGICVYQ